MYEGDTHGEFDIEPYRKNLYLQHIMDTFAVAMNAAHTIRTGNRRSFLSAISLSDSASEDQLRHAKMLEDFLGQFTNADHGDPYGYLHDLTSAQAKDFLTGFQDVAISSRLLNDLIGLEPNSFTTAQKRYTNAIKEFESANIQVASLDF